MQRAPGASSERPAEARRESQRASIQAIRAAGDLYRLAFDRWKAALPQESTCLQCFQSNGRLIVGLGSENVLETGITLHHTYGVPVIPGSALKGLASHYCHSVLGRTDDDYKIMGKIHKLLFGTLPAPQKQIFVPHEKYDTGHIIFNDGWLDPDCLGKVNQGPVPDVITPHHGDYYSGKQPEPTDFDEPNPVTFVSVSGRFYIAVSCDNSGPEAKAWAELAMGILAAALEDWGIGGKTSSGYGRLVPCKKEAATSAPSAQVAAMPADKPRFKLGDKVKVKLVGTFKSGKPKFEAEDGIPGQFLEQAPSVQPGDTVEAYVSNVTPRLYTFALKPPEPKRSK